MDRQTGSAFQDKPRAAHLPESHAGPTGQARERQGHRAVHTPTRDTPPVRRATRKEAKSLLDFQGRPGDARRTRARAGDRARGRGWRSELPVSVGGLHQHEHCDPTGEKKKGGDQPQKHLEPMAENRAAIAVKLLDAGRISPLKAPASEVEINHGETDRAGNPNRYCDPR